MSVPAAGDFVEVRTRRWLVESVTDGGALVRARLACIDDDAQGERLEVLWRDEVDASIIADSHMSVFENPGTDDPEVFSAYLRSIRWNTATAADRKLLQAPYRAGIHLDAYQLVPLAKAREAQNGVGKGRKLRGRSICYYIEFGGIFNDRMDIRFDPGGTVTVFGGTHSHGQGHATVFAQLVHEFLGVPFDQIRYVQGDTAQVQFGRGTYGARSAVVGGSALRRAADAIIDKAKLMAATILEADAGDIEFKGGNFTVAGTDKAIPLVEVAKASFVPMGPMTQFGIGLEGSGNHSPEPPSHPNGAHAVEVEIDPETGEVSVDRYVMVDDLGQVLNPMIVNGQQHGGVAQGIGQALYEHAVYDRSTAQLVTGSFMDYAMPRADMLPKFEIALEEVRCKTNPIGVKGIGESGTIGAPPVVINAIIDALGPLGIDSIDMPATPNRVWQAIQSAKGVA